MKPTTHRDICGTPKGYRRHYKNGEERCRPCLDSYAEHCRERRGLDAKMKPAETIAEIEWLLSLNQGEHYILKALGYTHNPASLERRLGRHGRHDLVRRLFRMEDAAA